MKKNNIFTFLDEIESKDELLKKWGDLYRAEKEILNKIVSARKEKKISQKQLAKITGLKQPAIARLENHVNSPQLDTVLNILNALDLKIEIKSSNKDSGHEDTSELQKVYDDVCDLMSCEVFSTQTYGRVSQEGGYRRENSAFEYTCKVNPTA